MATILRMLKIFSRYFLATFISSFENSLLRSISCFLNGLFVKPYAYWVLYILGINPLPNVSLAKIFPSPCGLSLHLLGYFLSCSAAFGFEVPLVSVGLNYWAKESVQKILPYTWIACCLYFLLAVFQASQCKVIGMGLISSFYICISKFPSTICWRCGLFSTVWFWNLCQILDDCSYV